jgi:glutamate-1-semialdehyde 2,1-aminomutase
MPVGAIGGPALVMDMMAPLGPVYQAGTLSGNPIAMAAGLATLEVISKPGFFDRLDASMKRLIDGLNAAALEAGVDFCARSVGGMGGVYMRATPPDTHGQALAQDNERFRKFYHLMLDGGVYLPPSPVEAFFLSSAHTAADIDKTVDVATRALKQVA